MDGFCRPFFLFIITPHSYVFYGVALFSGLPGGDIASGSAESYAKTDHWARVAPELKGVVFLPNLGKCLFRRSVALEFDDVNVVTHPQQKIDAA